MRGTERYEPVTSQQTHSSYDDRSGPSSEYHPYGMSSETIHADATGDSQRPAYMRYPSKFQEATDDKDQAYTRTMTDFSSDTQRSRKSVRETPAFEFFHDWWLELLSCFFIVGSLVALFVVARAYQDRPLPAWPHDISINSLLAIFVVILKAAMLLILAQGLSHLKWTWFTRSRPLNDLARYDNASRGPIGSLRLVWALRGRDLISSLGALVIVAVVILDPMAQQVIRYYNCSQPQPDLKSTLPRTNAYMEVGLHVAAGISTIPITFQSAINGGLFVPSAASSSAVSVDCPSGNCTFADPFFTVGFTSHCEDVSDELRLSNVTMSASYSYYTDSSDTVPETSTQNYTMLNVTLPSGLSTSYNVNAVQLTTFMAMGFNFSTGLAEIILGPKTSDPQSQGNLCTGDTGYTGDTNLSDWQCRGYGAARCSIVPAVFKVSSVVDSGQLSENLTMQTTDFNFADAASSTVDVSCLTSSQKKSLTSAGYTLPRPDEPQWLPYNVSLSNFANGTITYQGGSQNASDATLHIVPPTCIYQYSGTSLNSLNQFFATYLSGTITAYGTEYTGTSSVPLQFYNSSGITLSSVSTLFHNMSAAMTTHARANGWSYNSDPATGQVWHLETCIRVRWPLLVYPAVLAGLTLAFFVAMVLATRRAQHGVHHDFKSSPLALLFHGLDEGAQGRVLGHHGREGGARAGDGVESNEVGKMGEEAKGMYVRLRPTEKGWRFVADGDGKDELS